MLMHVLPCSLSVLTIGHGPMIALTRAATRLLKGLALAKVLAGLQQPSTFSLKRLCRGRKDDD